MLSITPSDRLCILACHPDDETLATGGVIQRAVRTGAEVRVVFLTDGDNNPWAQRLFERHWNPRVPLDRPGYGRRRRVESKQALGCLGLSEDHAVYLHFHDQDLTRLLLSGDASLFQALRNELIAWKPTLLFVPSLTDTHPDHNATGVIVRIVVSGLPPVDRPRSVLEYVIHGRPPSPQTSSRVPMVLSNEEEAKKRMAIGCYSTQLVFHPKRFFSFANEVEVFYRNESPTAGSAFLPLRFVSVGEHTVWVDMPKRWRSLPYQATRFHAVTLGESGRIASLSSLIVRDPPKTSLRVLPTDGDGAVSRVSFSRRRKGGYLLLPKRSVAGGNPVFVKLEQRWGVFDRAGWRELPPVQESSGGEGAAGAVLRVCAVIPCYNVVERCEAVLKEASRYADFVVAVDDGSTDGTSGVLEGVAAESKGTVTVLTLPVNHGKGNALLEGYRHALATLPFDILVSLDSDGQHQPSDIPRLVASCREGAEFVIGERLESEIMPWKSRLGNSLIQKTMQRLFPGCPFDTQSGFRAMDRAFVETVVSVLRGSRYETELQILLLALKNRLRIGYVRIPTIYLDENRASHFRPITDSARICAVLVKAILGN